MDPNKPDSPARAFPRETYIDEAIAHLKTARNMLVKAGAPKAADKARKALRSAEGAKRHASSSALV